MPHLVEIPVAQQLEGHLAGPKSVHAGMAGHFPQPAFDLLVDLVGRQFHPHVALQTLSNLH
jgi:hypothetical protein